MPSKLEEDAQRVSASIAKSAGKDAVRMYRSGFSAAICNLSKLHKTTSLKTAIRILEEQLMGEYSITDKLRPSTDYYDFMSKLKEDKIK